MQTLEYSHPPRSVSRSAPRYRRLLLAFALALTTLLGVAVYGTPQAHASSTGGTSPVIHWDESMIYPGQNNGNPEGPVGETAVVHGQNFTAGQQLALVVVPGDSDTTPTACQNQAHSTTVAHATVTAGGSFDATFSWPAEVASSTEYSICSLNTTDNSVVSSTDDGPFTVLSASKPTFSLSTTSAAAGSTITVTGQNWVPAQPLNVTIASCADCDPGSNNIAGATTTSLGRNSGSFSVNIPIPATMAPNNYVVNVTSQAGPLDAYHIDGLGVKQLAVTAAATPTPTAAPSPSVTAASTQTVTTTPTATAGSTSGSSSDNGNGNTLVMVILIVLAVALLAVGGGIFFVLAQRKKQSPGGTSPGALGANQANQFNASRTPMTPFPPSQSGPFGNAPNGNGAYSGYNQQGQSWPGNQPGNWQGNPQSNPGFNNFPQNQPFQPQQQGNYMFGSGMNTPAMNRQCMRCGSQLAPNAPVCGVCGTRNPVADPNDPTIAY